MTLAALLEELRGADPEQSEKLQCWMGRSKQVIGLEMPLECDLAQALIQASIQRACERQEWHWTIMKDPYQDGYRAEIAVVSESHLSDHICIDDLAIKCATSPAEALLAAYIAAVRGEAKR